MTKMGPIAQHLAEDHDRLDALLERARAPDGSVDMEAFELFRAGLLRHIAIEEKLLFTLLKRRAPELVPDVELLRAEHSAIARLLCYRPDARLIDDVRALLGPHNAREEGDEGIYAAAERAAGDELEALTREVVAFGAIRPAPYRETRDAPTAEEALAWAKSGKGLA